MDIYDTMMPVYILSKILGLAPVRMKGKGSNRCLVSDFGPIIMLRFIGVIGSMVYVAYLIDTLNLQYDLRGIALRCELYMGSVLTATMLIAAVTNRYILISIIEDITVIDKKMELVGINISYKNARRFAVFQIIGITCVFSSKAIIQPFTAERSFISIYNIFNIVDYINTNTLFQYVDLLLLLRQRYIWLNRKLKLLTQLVVKDGDYFQEKLHKQIKVKTVKRKSYDVLESRPEFAIQTLSKIHCDLFDVSRKINEAYSVRLLITVGMRFIMITTQLLTIYKMVFGKNPTKKYITFLLIGIYLFLHTSKTLMIAAISSNTADKARQTGVLLHNMWKCNSKIIQNVNYFSLQILQQDMCFEAEGFFKLDYELIYNMTAALTIYLIILIQFDATGTTQVPGCLESSNNITMAT